MGRIHATTWTLGLAFALLPAVATAESSFTIIGHRVVGDELELDITHRHHGGAKRADFYVNSARPSHSIDAIKRGVKVEHFTMKDGSHQRTLRVKVADLTSRLGLREGSTLYVSAFWPRLNHRWGTTHGYTQAGTTIRLPPLQARARSRRADAPGTGRWGAPLGAALARRSGPQERDGQGERSRAGGHAERPLLALRGAGLAGASNRADESHPAAQRWSGGQQAGPVAQALIADPIEMVAASGASPAGAAPSCARTSRCAGDARALRRAGNRAGR